MRSSEISNYHVVEYHIGIVREYAAIRVATERAGAFPGERDVWIAATARWLGWPLITNNRRHFEAVPGLDVRTAG